MKMKVDADQGQLAKELSSSREHYYSTPSTQYSPNRSSDKPVATYELKFYDHIAQQERGDKCIDRSNRADKTTSDKLPSAFNNSILTATDEPNATKTDECKSVESTASDTTSEKLQEATKKNEPKNLEEDLCSQPPEMTTSLDMNSNRVVVRPIAFKPVVPSKRHESSSPESNSFNPICHDEGYSSYDTSSRGCSNSVSALSKDSDTVYASPIHVADKHQNLEARTKLTMISDAEFERLLQEKESELVKLRRTMELNESAIIRVHEHKRIEWENQMKELAEEYHRRLRTQQDHGHDRESELRQTIAKLEIDNRQLTINVQQNKIDRDRQQHLAAQVQELKQRNTDLNHKLTRELCECDRLRHQNKELDGKIRKLQEQQSIGTLEQDRLNVKIAEMEEAKCHTARDHNLKLNQLQQQIEQQEQQLQQDKEKFQCEKRKWQDEKERVMHYQKQLQRTYGQMYRRNNELEQQLCRINSRRLARLETQSLQGSVDRHCMLDVDLESCPESFC